MHVGRRRCSIVPKVEMSGAGKSIHMQKKAIKGRREVEKQVLLNTKSKKSIESEQCRDRANHRSTTLQKKNRVYKLKKVEGTWNSNIKYQIHSK
jgi:hypothetical protein